MRTSEAPTAVVVALLGWAALAACGEEEGRAGPRVVATTGVLADVAGRVADPDAEVVQLVPDGADPHSFSLSAEDRLELEEADLVVASGAGLEAGIPLDDAGGPTWALADHVEALLPVEEGSETDDPHVWMDPTQVATAAPSLGEALAEADPDHAKDYRRRAATYTRALGSLDRRIERILSEVPRDDRELVTSHDSMAYFADRYGLEVIATAFPSSGAEGETSAAALADVEAAVRDSGVQAVFSQEGDNPEVLDLIAAETGVEVEDGLLVESPGPAGSYEEMMRRDAELIARSLGG